MWLQYLKQIGFGLLCLFLAGISNRVSAQLSMEFEIDEALENSQSINAQSLLSNNLRGPNLFNLYLENQNSSEYLNDLYLRVVIGSDEIGQIVEVEQVSGRPFSLNPGQQVYADNNNSGNGLPGVEEAILFDRNFTEQGRSFYNELKGSTSLPADQYRVKVEVYQGSVNGELLASQTAEVGTSLVEDVRDFYLLSPGDELGSEATISSSYPNFQWQGASDVRYRLLVVESRGDESPQSLIEGAMSTDPIESIGSNAGGALVDYEMLDVLVDGSGYQYPNSGVQELEPGNTYYWRIVSQLETNSGVQERESEIWNFTLADLRTSSDSRQPEETTRALEKILGDRFEEVRQNGYSFDSIEIEGQSFQSGQAMQKMLELVRKSEQGDISIVIEN